MLLRITGLIASALLISACSSEKQQDGLGKSVRDTIKARQAAKEAEGKPQAPAPQLTRAALVNIKKPLVQVDAQNLGLKSLFVLTARNGAYHTYISNNKMSITYHQGIISATRGFGLDLLSQGLSIPVAEMFSDTTQNYTRTQRQLEKLKKVAQLSYDCTMQQGDAETITIVEKDYSVVKYTETCRNDSRGFKNNYWVDTNTKTIRKSEQSIGQQAGFFITEALID